MKNPSFWNYHSYLWRPEVQMVNHPAYPDSEYTWQRTSINDYGPDIEMDHILEFIERSAAQQKPLFVYHTSHLGHQAVDMADPKLKITWNAETESYTRHQSKISPNGPVNTLPTAYQKENITPNELKHHVEYLGYQLWQYLTKLEEIEQLENTVIIFMADNGTKGWKASVVKQRGIHVPFVVYAPGQPNFVRGAQNIISDLTDLLPTLAEIMGVPWPSSDDYELNGQSLWPYLTQQTDHHREWIYGYKGPKQMICGPNLLRDGDSDWWDVSQIPSDHDDFPRITDFSTLSPSQQKEKTLLEKILPDYAREDIGGATLITPTPRDRFQNANSKKCAPRPQRCKNTLSNSTNAGSRGPNFELRERTHSLEEQDVLVTRPVRRGAFSALLPGH